MQRREGKRERQRKCLFLLSSQTLVVSMLVSSCSCLAPPPPPLLATGSAITFPLTFTSGKEIGRWNRGRKERSKEEMPLLSLFSLPLPRAGREEGN